MDAAIHTAEMSLVISARRRYLLIALNVTFVLAILAPTLGIFFRFPPRVYLYNVPTLRKPNIRSWTAFTHGSYQHALDGWAYQQSRFWAVFAKAQNTFNYHVFGLASEKYSNETLAGKNGVLFDRIYVNDLNGVRLSPVPKARGFAKRIKDFQDLVESQGKTFLVVLHPNKAVLNPDWVSEDLKTGKPKERIVSELLPSMLDAGIHVVKIGDFFTDPQVRYWPASGAHLNKLGKCLSGKAVLQTLATLGRTSLPSLDCSYKADRVVSPEGEDLDLVRLVNGWKLGRSIQPVPETVLRRTEPVQMEATSGPLPKLLLVGTSYLFGLTETLTKADSYSSIDFIFYNKIRYYTKNRGTTAEESGKVAFRAYMHSLAFILSHDVVILEATETRLHQLGFGIINAVTRQLRAKSEAGQKRRPAARSPAKASANSPIS